MEQHLLHRAVVHWQATQIQVNNELGVDYRPGRLSAPILSILPIIDIGHFQNIFADIFLYNIFFFFFFFYANKHTIYRWNYLLVTK